MKRLMWTVLAATVLSAGAVKGATRTESNGQARVLMPLANGFNDMEFWGIYTGLRAAGFHVDVAAPAMGALNKGARAAKADLVLDDVDVSRYVGMAIAGGSSPGTLAKIPKALEICQAFMAADKPVGGDLPRSFLADEGRCVEGSGQDQSELDQGRDPGRMDERRAWEVSGPGAGD